MEAQPIFKYQSARRYLIDYVDHKQTTDPEFSLRKWTKSMGMSSHAHLVMILQGKRPLTLKQVPYFTKGMNLSSPERLYLQALIQFENAQTPEEKSLCQLWLSEANPGHDFKVREVDEYIVIAHWVHMAILSMTGNKNFKGTAEDIQRRLGNKTTVAEVRSALERLKALNLLVEKNGNLECTFGRVTTKDDVANRGAREYHKQIAKLAVDAIEAQSVHEREFQSFAVSVPHLKIGIAKEMIRKFRTQFYEAMTSEPGDEVYQTQIQFFRLTECSSELGPKEDEGTGSTNPKKVQQE
jgi:uncharacterized protein (TIGR02147 family)